MNVERQLFYTTTPGFELQQPDYEYNPSYRNAGIDLCLPKLTKTFLMDFIKNIKTLYVDQEFVKLGREDSLVETLQNGSAKKVYCFLVAETINGKQFRAQKDVVKLLDPESIEHQEFFERLFSCEVDFHLYFKIHYYNTFKDFVDSDTICRFNVKQDNKINDTTFEYDLFIRKPIQISTGVHIDIPQDCAVDLRSKSSSFKNNFTVVTGLIDNTYTGAMGLQVIPLALFGPDSCVCLQSNQKVAQITMWYSGMNSEHFTRIGFSKQPYDNFFGRDSVQKKLSLRNGGFGSTGKFVNK